VVGSPNSGKSTQLRSMFLDVRFGTNQTIPDATNLPDTYQISNERRLYLRLTSPHEMDEDIKTFLDKTESKMPEGRWCFASPLQDEAGGKMPDLVRTIRAFYARFSSERIRVCFLSPDRHGQMKDADYLEEVGSQLLQFDGLEYISIDARNRESNGLILADFFDFT
jgi:hypothetical protein